MLDFTAAEYSTIGCILIDARCFPSVREVLPTAEPFASDRCRNAYEAACRLADWGDEVDPVAVGYEAGLDDAFLRECMTVAPTCTGATQYAKAVQDGYQRRQLQALGEALQERALAVGTDPTSS